MKILIFGAGWLGHKFKDYLGAELTDTDISDKRAVEKVLHKKKPDTVLNAAGKTGRPNIDWCEDHKLETVESNVTGPLVLAKACLEKNIYLVHLASGCIFNGRSKDPHGFNETNTPQPPSFYSWTKTWADEILKNFPVLILRLRMPIDDTPDPRNLITKLSKYPKIVDVENSVTIVSDLLLAAKELMQKKKTGIYHVTNPGSVKHSQILKWYKEIVDPNHVYELISADQLLKQNIVKAGRSNCILDTRKLEKEKIYLRPVKDAIPECMIEYKKNLIQKIKIGK